MYYYSIKFTEKTFPLLFWLKSPSIPVAICWQYPMSATCPGNSSLQIKSVVRGFDPGTFGALGHRIAYAARPLNINN